MWPTQSLTGWHFCTWLVGWLTGYLTKCQHDPPQTEIVCGQVCDYFIFGSGWPLVRCTPQAETSCGQVWYYCRSGWPVYWRVSLVPAATVIPAPWAYIKVVAVKKLVLCFVFICLDNLSHIWAHTILCNKPQTEKVVCTWKDACSPCMTAKDLLPGKVTI